MREWKEKLGFEFMVLAFAIRDFLRPRRVILEEAGLRPGQVVLDYGCGTGSYVFEAAQEVGETGMVYALDRNPYAVRWIRERAKRFNLQNVRVILSNLHTGLGNASVDVVLLYDVLHMLRQVDDVLFEIQRVLKPGGVLSVSDHHLRSETIVAGVTSGGLFELTSRGKHTHSFRPRSVPGFDSDGGPAC